MSVCSNRRETGATYYKNAMQSHGLPGKIPTSFTTGKSSTLQEGIKKRDHLTIQEPVSIIDYTRKLYYNGKKA